MISIKGLTVSSGKVLLDSVSLEIQPNKITSIIGPAGSGKTTLLKCLNRMIDLENGLKVSGTISYDGLDVLSKGANVYDLRQRFTLVLALPVPLPKSIYENIACGARIMGISDRARLNEIVERCLREAALWDEVKDRLDDFAFKLSGGQQQRLCIARALALNPELIMFDESTSGLDPISTAKIEESVLNLKKKTTIIWVTNNVMQAARISDFTAFLLMGKLIEFAPTAALFTSPCDKRTNDYISGKFG